MIRVEYTDGDVLYAKNMHVDSAELKMEGLSSSSKQSQNQDDSCDGPCLDDHVDDDLTVQECDMFFGRQNADGHLHQRERSSDSGLAFGRQNADGHLHFGRRNADGHRWR